MRDFSWKNASLLTIGKLRKINSCLSQIISRRLQLPVSGSKECSMVSAVIKLSLPFASGCYWFLTHERTARWLRECLCVFQTPGRRILLALAPSPIHQCYYVSNCDKRVARTPHVCHNIYTIMHFVRDAKSSSALVVNELVWLWTCVWVSECVCMCVIEMFWTGSLFILSALADVSGVQK